MGKMENEVTEISTPEKQATTESHYHSKKDRIFVRGIAGQYSLKDELARLRDMPRVRHAKDIKFRDGPQTYSRHYVEQKHGHVNEAAFYILDGEGYEVHDGVRYDWKAGDIAIVHNNCVHQHFNASAREPARALVIKTKPMYLFMNMLFQHTVIKRPKTPSPTQGNFVPRDDEEDFNHPSGKVEEEV